MYKECSIQSASGGFGMYEAKEYNGDEWESAEDLLHFARDMDTTIYELGVDDLPYGVENILGRIHNQPDRVFYFAGEDQVTNVEGDLVSYRDGEHYFGISEFGNAP